MTAPAPAATSWQEYSSSTSWDIADAMRTTANNEEPGSARLEFRDGKYYVMVRK